MVHKASTENDVHHCWRFATVSVALSRLSPTVRCSTIIFTCLVRVLHQKIRSALNHVTPIDFFCRKRAHSQLVYVLESHMEAKHGLQVKSAGPRFCGVRMLLLNKTMNNLFLTTSLYGAITM